MYTSAPHHPRRHNVGGPTTPVHSDICMNGRKSMSIPHSRYDPVLDLENLFTNTSHSRATRCSQFQGHGFEAQGHRNVFRSRDSVHGTPLTLCSLTLCVVCGF